MEIIIQLHKGGSSTTNVQSYTPTAEEVRLQKASADYAEYVAPNARKLNDIAGNLLYGSIGTVQQDFDALNKNAQQQIANAQNGVAGLTTGQLPAQYQANMEAALQRGVQNTMGSTLDSLASRGVLNSSVSNKAMSDISKSVSDTMAEQYQNNIGALNGLYGQQASLATGGIQAGAAAQEAAQSPALNLWNASLGLNGATTSALAGVAGQGTTTSTSTQSGGGGGLFGGLLGAGASIGSALIACFTDNTDIAMAKGNTKKISEIKVGDKVKGINPITGEYEICNVTEVMQPTHSEIVGIMTEDGDFVFTTKTQPLLTEENGWVLVDNISVGDVLKNVGKIRAVIACGIRKVFDIKVDGCGSYVANGFVARGGVDEW